MILNFVVFVLVKINLKKNYEPHNGDIFYLLAREVVVCKRHKCKLILLSLA